MSYRYSTTPFYGMIPKNYPETCADLIASRCYQKKPEIPQFYVGRGDQMLVCNDCFKFTIVPHHEKVRVVIEWHKVGLDTENLLSCDICLNEIIYKRPVIECGYCTDIILTL